MTCTFNLSGAPSGVGYVLPTEGMFAGLWDTPGDGNTFIGNSNLCTIAGSVMTCANVPTSGAVGTTEVVIHRPSVAWYPNKGTVTLSAAITPLTVADIPNLTVACGTANRAPVNATTSCTFILPTNKTLPSDFKLSIGTGSVNAGGTTPAQACTIGAVPVANTVTCSSVPTGNSTGNLPIFGNLGTGTTATKTATGETVNITGTNMAKVNWNFTPDKGSRSPLFRSTDGTSIAITNLKTNFDLNPSSNTRYTCKLEYRNLNDRLATTPAWTALSSTGSTPSQTPAYSTTTGCGFSIAKAQRNNNLNFSLRLTITDTTNTAPTAQNPNTFILHNEYIYRFLGAGIASGG